MKYLKDFLFGVTIFALFFIVPGLITGSSGFPFSDYFSKITDNLYLLGLIYGSIFTTAYALLTGRGIKNFSIFFVGFYLSYLSLILLIFYSFSRNANF